jgi:putative tryptophan/tyrosine transport system substrate-binding protein
LQNLQEAAKITGQQLLVRTASSDRDFEEAFASIVTEGAAALLITSDPFFFQSSNRLIALAARYRVPTIFWTSENVAAGGLMSYGASISDAFRLVGIYAGRILKGANCRVADHAADQVRIVYPPQDCQGARHYSAA